MLWLFACAPDYALDQKVAPPLSGPEIRVEPAAVDFGAIDTARTGAATVTVFNDGDARLVVSGLLLDDASGFSVLQEPPVVDPGQSVTLDLGYVPGARRSSDILVIESDDADEPTVEVPLTGIGLFPVLAIDPNPFDTGGLQPGCGDQGVVTLKNIGGADLIVDTMVPIGDGFEVVSAPSFPLTLAPTSTAEIEVLFRPEAELDYTTELWFTSNDPAGVSIATLLGHGETPPDAVQEVFRQPDGPWDMVDMVFYVDRSGSMTDDQIVMRNNFDTLMSNLDFFITDYQIGVVTDDSGCVNGALITPETDDPVSAFGTALSGPSGSFTEAGFSILFNALHASGSRGCNAGLIREDAKTLAILVSDEEEQSEDDVPAWMDVMIAEAPSLTVAAVAGPPSGCASADPGKRYLEAVEYTGGIFLSICESDWSAYFQKLGDLATEAPSDTFPLSWVPDPDTIEVTVTPMRGDPEDQPADRWTWDETQNAVVFGAGFMPPARSEVVIDYVPAASCG